MRKFMRYILEHHCLNDEQMNEFGLRDPLFVAWMRKKWDFKYHASWLDYNLISLGEDCLPRYIPVKWGLAPTAREGHERLPFDLAVTPIASLVEVLQCPERLRADGIAEVGGKQIFISHTPPIRFNHDFADPATPQNMELERFNETLFNRLASFKRLLSQKNNIFVWHSTANRVEPSLLQELHELVTDKYGGHLLILNRFAPPPR